MDEDLREMALRYYGYGDGTHLTGSLVRRKARAARKTTTLLQGLKHGASKGLLNFATWRNTA
jgi:hypothetical protein